MYLLCKLLFTDGGVNIGRCCSTIRATSMSGILILICNRRSMVWTETTTTTRFSRKTFYFCARASISERCRHLTRLREGQCWLLGILQCSPLVAREKLSPHIWNHLMGASLASSFRFRRGVAVCDKLGISHYIFLHLNVCSYR